MNYTTAQGIMSRGNGELLAHSQPNAYTLSVNEFMAQNTEPLVLHLQARLKHIFRCQFRYKFFYTLLAEPQREDALVVIGLPPLGGGVRLLMGGTASA